MNRRPRSRRLFFPPTSPSSYPAAAAGWDPVGCAVVLRLLAASAAGAASTASLVRGRFGGLVVAGTVATAPLRTVSESLGNQLVLNCLSFSSGSEGGGDDPTTSRHGMAPGVRRLVEARDVSVTYSRSSGPGGQDVNKTSASEQQVSLVFVTPIGREPRRQHEAVRSLAELTARVTLPPPLPPHPFPAID